eukprot:Em0003g1459a
MPVLDSRVALDSLSHQAVSCRHGGDTVIRHNKLHDIIADLCHKAHLSVRVEAGHETRKHAANDPKCRELGWMCIPMAVETQAIPKPKMLSEIYSRLNMSLVRSVARAIMGREAVQGLIPLRSFASCWLDGHLASGWRYASGHARKASSKSSKEQTKETDKKVQSAVSKAREGLLGKAYKVLSSSEIAPNTPETWNLLHQKHPRGPVPSHPEVTLPSEGFKLPPDFDIMSVLRQFPKDSACGPSASDSKCSELLFNMWYLDDGTLAGPKAAVNRAILLIQQVGPPQGLRINTSKCEVSSQGDLDGFPANIKRSHEPNFEILGAPIGDVIFLCQILCSKASQGSQVAVSAVGARSTPPSLVSEGLALFDEEVRRYFTDCVAINASDSDWLQVQLSLSRAGLGLPDILVPNWLSGKPAAFDLTVISPLNSKTLNEAGATGGSATGNAEARKHTANDQKCRELGWVCVPLAVETYGCWGEEAQCSVSHLAARLALQLPCSKSKAITNIYQRLNLTLVRCNARALLSWSRLQTCSMQRTWVEGTMLTLALQMSFLVQGWDRGKPAAFDVTVASPLTPVTLNNASTSAILKPKILGDIYGHLNMSLVRSVARAIMGRENVRIGVAAHKAECRKHSSNDPKCQELGWVCVPLAVESYENWGKEAQNNFTRLASILSISLHCPKAKVLTEIYGRLNISLVRVEL